MSHFHNTALIGASGSAGEAYQIDRSLRFNSADSAYLNRTPSSAGSRKTWTWSGWLKRCQFSTLDGLFFQDTGTDDTNYGGIFFNTDGTLAFNGWSTVFRRTSAVYRDPGAWMHIVVACDTTLSDADSRMRFYVNGTEITDWHTKNTITQNADLSINKTSEHRIGRVAGSYANQYLTEVQFVDGQQLAASDFGEYDSNNVWQPKEFAGTYGTNGFRLDFSDNSSDQALGYDAAVTAPTLNPKGGMDVVTYTGNGSTQTIGGLAFQPDLVWVKQRNTSRNHQLVDSVRGATIDLRSNTTAAESTTSTGLTAFNPDGFTLGGDAGYNQSGGTYVAWAWKAGGPAQLNEDGSIDSQVSVSTDYGFSILTFTAGTAPYTIGHGLGSIPKLIILKSRTSSAASWNVYHDSTGNQSRTYLNHNYAASSGEGCWNNTSPTSSVFSIGNSGEFTGDMVAYCWSEVSGFSKFGSYSGTGSSGNSITGLGFKPRYLMVKRTDSSESWVIYDTARDDGTMTSQLYAESSSAESAGGEVAVNSDGFTVNATGTGLNANGGTYIYMAFADRPGNNWTPNNLTANAVDYAATGSDPNSKITNGSIDNFWDNSVSTSVTIAQGGYVVMADLGSTPIGTATTNVGFYTNNGASTATLRINGTSVFEADSTTTQWYDFNFTGAVYKVELGYLGGSGSSNRFYAFRIDGTTIVGDSPANTDSLIDTPTNYEASSGNNGGNYCTMNPLANSGLTLSNGNLDFTSSGGNRDTCIATHGVSSGKWYWEVTVGNTSIGVGIEPEGYYPASDSRTGLDSAGYSWWLDRQKKYHNNGTNTSYGASVSSGDIIGVALDLDGGTLTFYKNNSSQGTAYTGISGTYLPAISDISNALSASGNINFGQRPFAYTPPSGHLAVVTTNLTDPTIADGSTAMDVALWTGTGATRSITGLGFSPDFVWIKKRSGTTAHNLFDIVRGANKPLFSNLTNAELSDGRLTAFNSDGFTLDSDNAVNDNNQTHVGWAWDGGTTTATNTDGSITSNVRANASAGFSIVSFTASGSAGSDSCGHGLNAVPGLVIIKRRDAVDSWYTWHSSLSNLQRNYLLLDSSAAVALSSNDSWGAGMTSSVIGFRSQGTAVGNMIAYCFTPVAGYSDFGSYNGNGSTDGPFVYTGFRPAFIMLKRTDSTAAWQIRDTSRSPDNVVTENLYPNLTNVEETDSSLNLDILSNGFKPRNSSGSSNASSGTYIYAAFAEHPFKTARAR